MTSNYLRKPNNVYQMNSSMKCCRLRQLLMICEMAAFVAIRWYIRFTINRTHFFFIQVFMLSIFHFRWVYHIKLSGLKSHKEIDRTVNKYKIDQMLAFHNDHISSKLSHYFMLSDFRRISIAKSCKSGLTLKETKTLTNARERKIMRKKPRWKTNV